MNRVAPIGGLASHLGRLAATETPFYRELSSELTGAPKELWDRYRQGALYAYVAALITAGVGGMQAEYIALEGLRRKCRRPGRPRHGFAPWEVTVTDDLRSTRPNG